MHGVCVCVCVCVCVNSYFRMQKYSQKITIAQKDAAFEALAITILV